MVGAAGAIFDGRVSDDPRLFVCHRTEIVDLNLECDAGYRVGNFNDSISALETASCKHNI